MKMTEQAPIVWEKENEGCVRCYPLSPGIFLSFNQIYTDSWTKGDSSFFSENMLIMNFCMKGRCDVSLAGNRYAIVKGQQVCISTILPTKDFYYPGRRYEGIQIYIDRKIFQERKEENFLTMLGIDIPSLSHTFCQNNGLYLHRMSDRIAEVTADMWEKRDRLQAGDMRYYAVTLLHELRNMPCKSESGMYFTRSQIAIVKEAEALILCDLSKRITAKEMAERFGISESSFKLYVKGILGESYLVYFRKKRMEKAAELLKTTPQKVIDIANAVGYENQGKFAKVFAGQYGMSPVEYRRMERENVGKEFERKMLIADEKYVRIKKD